MEDKRLHRDAAMLVRRAWSNVIRWHAPYLAPEHSANLLIDLNDAVSLAVADHAHRGRPGWDEYFLEIAETVALRSDCDRSKVGAVIVRDNRIRATGYNGAPAGEPGCVTCLRRTSGCAPNSSYDTGPGSCIALHAEQNAVLHCDRGDLRGATLYVTREPCPGCAKLISGTGITRIVHS